MQHYFSGDIYRKMPKQCVKCQNFVVSIPQIEDKFLTKMLAEHLRFTTYGRDTMCRISKKTSTLPSVTTFDILVSLDASHPILSTADFVDGSRPSSDFTKNLIIITDFHNATTKVSFHPQKIQTKISHSVQSWTEIEGMSPLEDRSCRTTNCCQFGILFY